MEIDICPRWMLNKLGVPCDLHSHAGLLFSSMIVLLSPLLLIHIPHFCLLQRYLHIPCPGCGVTHSMLAMLRLNVLQAWHFNPAGVLFIGMLCFQFVARPLALVSERTRPAINQLSRRGSFAILACLITVWILRLCFGGFHNGIDFLSQM